jgi:hypothetical protein
VPVALGRSEVGPAKSDRRFSDPAWSGNPIFSRIERGYLATAQAVSNVVDELGDGAQDRRRAEQARFATTILTSALAPTNFFATNPAAIKRAFDTRATVTPSDRSSRPRARGGGPPPCPSVYYVLPSSPRVNGG